MNRKRAFIVLVVLLLVVLVGLWKWPRSQPTQSTQDSVSPQQPATPAVSATSSAQESTRGVVIPDLPGANLTPEDKTKIGKIVEVFSAPIDFWGKVIDQHGDPVPGAKVHYSAADKYFKDGSKYEGISDEQGLFSINNIKGAGLYVRVAKEGYYHVDDQSARSFGYGMPTGGAPPSKANPAILVLHKMGETEPMIKSVGTVRLPRDGTPTEITLRKERPVAVGSARGDLRVEVWTDDANKDEHRRYDWRCRVTIPGGGLFERTGPFDFAAPADGYSSVFEQAMPRSGSRWTNNLKKEFFVKLSDGCFARVRFELAAGGDHFVYLESFLNPKPGSRNLEFDPKLNTSKP
ncbi:MAG: carboxypeptidase regulatory-like domain-containing protein [Opitutaceae bacterium]|nr:carboxypeptidase regulatory-like domain-containing protein [Opitutaceae bacterium]MBP9911843.1 carboxypeptidase regulatory-like domain-containing protein [Opitutaceae bacterium]